MQLSFSLIRQLCVLLVLSSLSNLQAQERPYRKFATQQMQNELKLQDAQLPNRLSAVERKISKFRKVPRIGKVQIPVVFHILHQTPEERISYAQVYSQMEALNRDFSMQRKQIGSSIDSPEKFKGASVNALQIEFCFPKLSPNGKLTDGINYVETSTTAWPLNNALKSSQKGGSSPWSTDRYLNVWIVHLKDDISGYAQMPGGPEKTDGIVIDYRYFGTLGTVSAPYDEGKTLTHLIGNYLGLYDLWGEANCTDDYVNDTPIHNAPNIGCPTGKHISTCGNHPVEMTMNFMDNTDDACMYMFTLGQMLRMHATLSESGARNLLSQTETICDYEKQVDDPIRNILDLRSLELEQDRHLQAEVRVYPNPANNEINIEVTGQKASNATIMIYNAIGKVMYQSEIPTVSGVQTQLVNSSDWAPGLYFVHTSIEGQSIVYQLAIARH